MELTLIYPAFNEEQGLRSTVERSVAALRDQGRSFEVLLINDASGDGTGPLMESLAEEFPEVRALHNPVNLGQGGTIKRGFREARGELVIHNGVDYPFDLNDFPILYDAMEGVDIVVASRRGLTGQGLYRAVLSRVNRLLLRLLFPLKLTDYNYVQLYRKTVLEAIQVSTDSTAFVTPELLIRASEAGFKLREVPVRYHPRRTGRATAGSLKVVLSSVRDLLGFWWSRVRGDFKP